eukprot:SAG31_NODE_2273_length_6037_cov_11.461862_4_plen_152_part_00
MTGLQAGLLSVLDVDGDSHIEISEFLIRMRRLQLQRRAYVGSSPRSSPPRADSRLQAPINRGLRTASPATLRSNGQQKLGRAVRATSSTTASISRAQSPPTSGRTATAGRTLSRQSSGVSWLHRGGQSPAVKRPRHFRISPDSGRSPRGKS